jgi:hypothetical protein
MKKIGWQLRTALVLILTSVILYIFYYALFREEPVHIFQEVVAHIAFLPMHVLIITLIIHGLLEIRDKRALLEKLNMVIGIFFSEVGSRLLDRLTSFDPELEQTRANFKIGKDWTDKDFKRAAAILAGSKFDLSVDVASLRELKDFFREKQGFLLRLLENSNLLEHDAFTDLLWKVFHVAEELEFRDDPGMSPPADLAHLEGDIKRVYASLIGEWLSYMLHLKVNYPYLFSFALRTSPFDEAASVVIED